MKALRQVVLAETDRGDPFWVIVSAKSSDITGLWQAESQGTKLIPLSWRREDAAQAASRIDDPGVEWKARGLSQKALEMAIKLYPKSAWGIVGQTTPGSGAALADIISVPDLKRLHIRR